LETEHGGYVQLSHVAQLIPEHYLDGRAHNGLVRAVLASGAEQVVESGFASELEARDAVRAVLALARTYDRHGDTGAVATLQQALEGVRRLAAAAMARNTLRPAPERNSSFPPAPGKLSEEEIKRIDGTLADAAEYARAVNEGRAVAPIQRPAGADTAADPQQR